MTQDKFKSEVETVYKFTQLYCDNKHKNIKKNNDKLVYSYRDIDLNQINYNLCDDCLKIFLYSYSKLQNCEYEEKPRCRKCETPCYEKSMWKQLATIMKYSGIKFGLIKIKNFFSNKL